MAAWFNSLSELEKVFSYIAFPATAILLLQLVMLLIGLGGDHADADVDSSVDGIDSGETIDIHGSDGLHIFSIRGIVSFFAMFGWTGILASRQTDSNVFISVLAGFVAGFVTMLVVAHLVRMFLKLQTDGSLDYKNALGLPATVYITIPPARSERGKVNTILQGRYIEADAVTDEETPIRFGEEAVVIGLSGNNTLIVKRK